MAPPPDSGMSDHQSVLRVVLFSVAGPVPAFASATGYAAQGFGGGTLNMDVVNNGTIFSLDPATIPLLRDTYGADVILFAANHPFDQGTEGFIESLEHFEANGIPYAGAGRNLEEALTPATVEVNGLTFGFTGHNEIPGPIPAGPDQPQLPLVAPQRFGQGGA